MDTLIHADIFFFVTTIVVILIGICLVAILIIGIQIMRNLKRFSETLKKEGELVAEDIAMLRGELRSNGMHAISFMKFFKHLFKKDQQKKHDAKHHAAHTAHKPHDTHDSEKS